MPGKQHHKFENEMLDKIRSAAILGISVKFLDRLIRRKSLPAYQEEGNLLFFFA